jgi:hypothetical protein
MIDILRLSFEEAKAQAEAEAKRVLQLDRAAVRYVKFDPVLFKDFCRVDIQFDQSGRGPVRLLQLPLADRHEDEKVSDADVVRIAQSGDTIAAIRLYRMLHQVDLASAMEAVEALVAS